MTSTERIPIYRQIRRMPDLVRSLYPDARVSQARQRITVGDLQGMPGQSTIINLVDGWAHDFNGGAHIDIVGVVAARLGYDEPDAIRWLRRNGWLSDGGAAPDVPRREPAQLRYLPLAPSDVPLPTRSQTSAWARRMEIEPTDDAHLYPYRVPDGRVALVIVRWPTAGGKEVRRVSWGRGSWRLGGTEGAIFPLFRLPDVVMRYDLPVIIAEGEKAANAAGSLWPDYVATCPVGGSNPAPTEWDPLRGRDVLVLPDSDDAGATFALRVRDALDGVAARVRLLDPGDVYRALGGEGEPPRGWDVADA